MVDGNTVVVNARIDGRESDRETERTRERERRNQINIEPMHTERKREREYDKQLFLLRLLLDLHGLPSSAQTRRRRLCTFLLVASYIALCVCVLFTAAAFARSFSFFLFGTHGVIMREKKKKDDALCSLFILVFLHQFFPPIDGRRRRRGNVVSGGHWICAPDETIDAFYARAKGKENDVDVDEGNNVDERDQFAALFPLLLLRLQRRGEGGRKKKTRATENNRNASRSIEKRARARRPTTCRRNVSFEMSNETGADLQEDRGFSLL